MNRLVPCEFCCRWLNVRLHLDVTPENRSLACTLTQTRFLMPDDMYFRDNLEYSSPLTRQSKIWTANGYRTI
ncbi:uncharacterized protein PHALS_14790 [Plasmopara halstedii]|uniref:Uncharacterized protein n=1 Tax=Plasmopara halstedii TaxID=4781 RepID=A0A0N7L6T9_PLAHL|nr:uncharacterized protein PHALS_14790 [Plasmopara halstedii]CEG45203.1 hypothetical protein PHALS_14790 [Plasmopara halstedii]|eukprot:XP_024581572.1 hypothetical protein PHALS_14790 [Plasmopara halstedii]